MVGRRGIEPNLSYWHAGRLVQTANRSNVELRPIKADKKLMSYLLFGCKPIEHSAWWGSQELNLRPQGFPCGRLALFL